MKKKLFLMAFMVLMLVLAFAISAFAQDIVSKTESEEYGTIIQLNADPGLDNAAQYVSTLNKINDAGTDKSALCILTDGNTDNPSYYVFPASYVVNETEDGVFDIIATDLAQAIADFNTANGTNYYASYAVDGSGGGKRLNSLVRFEFPSSVTSANANTCCIRSYSSLVEIRINHSIDFSKAEKMFYSNKKLATVKGFELVDGTKLPKTMFASCTALRYIKLPANTTKIPGSFFQGAEGVNVVNMAELTQLTTIDSWAFDGTKNLVITLPDSVTTLHTSAFESAFKNGGSITINPTSQLTSIGNKAFAGSNQLKSIYIPSTVTSIGETAFYSSGITTIENFENCQITVIRASTFEAASKLTSIKLPETVTTIEAKAFNGNTSLKKIYIPASVTSMADSFNSGPWTEPPANLVVLYIGKDTSIFSEFTRYADANVIAANDYNENAAYTGLNIVVGYSYCVAYNDGNHNNKLIDVTLNSYLEDGTKLHECTVCGTLQNGEKLPALFMYVGCSTPLNGRGEMTIGFVPNYESIAIYEEITGKSLRFGVFAAEKTNLGESDIFDKDGNAPANVICADLTDVGCAMFDLRIVGFNTAELKTVKLAMGAFVAATKDAETQYFYLQEAAPSANEKYYFVSYNDVAKIAK